MPKAVSMIEGLVNLTRKRSAQLAKTFSIGSFPYKESEGLINSIVRARQLNKPLSSTEKLTIKNALRDLSGAEPEAGVEGLPKVSENALHSYFENPSKFVKGVEGPSITTGTPGLYENVRNYTPEQIAQTEWYRDPKDWIRVAGLTGALGGGMAVGGLLDPSEAEASPIGKLVAKTVKGPVSSAAKRLIGHEISGMKIKNVVKGKEPWRYITFEGTDRVMSVRKDVINDLARQFGEEMYTGIAEASRPVEALKMAIKSAEMRLNLKGTGPYTKDELAALEAQHISNLQELELQPRKKILGIYRGEKIQLPEVYADILEKYNLFRRAKVKGK